jgi:hypothetical protein
MWWVDGKRRCGTCKLYLDPAMFSKNSKREDGLHFRCKDCERNNYIFRFYGITAEQYEEKLKEQGGACAICGIPPTTKRLAVDHDHACCPGVKSCGGCVRKLLCENCNHLLGKAEDNAARLRAAADYLDEWNDR